jgi:hypothetical protein
MFLINCKSNLNPSVLIKFSHKCFSQFTFKALALLKLDAVPKLLALALKAAQQELRKVGML